MSKTDLLREIPKVDAILSCKELCCYEGTKITESVRAVINKLRENILNDKLTEIPTLENIITDVISHIDETKKHSLRPVINATGIILHTNLGRACLSENALAAIESVACGYSTLEYDLEKGKRGSRHDHVEKLLCKITGAQAAMAVNNNAAAVLLVLSAMTKGKEVIVSRGELVEIGGSFRVPEVMQMGGAILKEVGTTNKTHLFDYANAIGENTGALLKVHTSNYRIFGFTEAVPLKDLIPLGKAHNIPVIEDLGSGLLIPPERFNLPNEPYVLESVKNGADVVTFSGDKLLGGPQAGIIVGKKEYIETIKKHQLARALRIDKLTLAALEATLMAYCDEENAIKEIPVLNMLSMSFDELLLKAQMLSAEFERFNIEADVIEDEGQVGGGSVPDKTLSSYGVAIKTDVSLLKLEEALRLGKNPIVGHISHDKFILNVLTLKESDFSLIANAVDIALKECL
ncbi:MAG: L-seryl-tRNA(Sec) selenium transferase [Oscillospiraceae bacterium]